MPCAFRIGSVQLLFEIVQVVVLITIAPRLAQPDTVDDGGVVELVADDGILRPQQGLEQPTVSVESGAIQNGVFHAQEMRQALLQRLVQILGAADEANGTQAEATLRQRGTRGFQYFWMRRQAQIVVGTKVNEFAAILRRDGTALGRRNDALRLEQARFLDGVELLSHVAVEVFGCWHDDAPVESKLFDKVNCSLYRT